MIEHQSLNHQSLGLSSCSNRSHLLAQRAIQDVTLEAPVLAAEQRRRGSSFNHGKRKSRYVLTHLRNPFLENINDVVASGLGTHPAPLRNSTTRATVVKRAGFTAFVVKYLWLSSTMASKIVRANDFYRVTSQLPNDLLSCVIYQRETLDLLVLFLLSICAKPYGKGSQTIRRFLGLHLATKVLFENKE
ncbi:hypothetical protein HZ326_18101 [Fusarium oxysporum f. sp. albedinis]|nr:hypothetical protein HZ326_18101 [Fusarium oxysporum f. sp. albedinis]